MKEWGSGSHEGKERESGVRAGRGIHLVEVSWGGMWNDG